MNEGIEAIARICHEANRAWCEHHGDFSQKVWEEAPLWARQSAFSGVKAIVDDWTFGEEISAEKSHSRWVDHKKRLGWQYAPVKDAERKVHPCMVPWQDLSDRDKRKDVLFTQIVLSFLE